MKTTEEGKWICETEAFWKEVAKTRKEESVWCPITSALQQNMMKRNDIQDWVRAANYRELCRHLETKLTAATEFARWCISSKFDSRDISVRAREVLEATNE